MTNWIQYTDYTAGAVTTPQIYLRQFLEICWPFVHEITLSSRYDLILSPRFPPAWERREEWENYKAALCPWLVGSRTSDWWFGYGRGSSKMTRYRYRADDGLKEKLCSLYQDIFLRVPIGQPREEFIPWLEDMCLFSQGKLFFGSVSHEEDAFLYPLNDEMRRDISSLGIWKDCTWRDERSRIAINSFVWKK